FLPRPRPPRSPLFPYTTLFRSVAGAEPAARTLACRAALYRLDQGFRCRPGDFAVLLAGGSADAQGTNHFAIDHDRHAALKRGERSEEHTSELQSRENLVCRLLL